MADKLLAAVVALGAFVYLYADWRLPSPAIGDPLGPKAFPALIGLGLLGAALLLFIEATAKPRAAPAAAKTAGRREHLALLGVAAWTALYYTAFEPVGYPLATALYLLVLLACFNRRRWKTNLAVALGFTALAYAVFDRFLGVAMPLGLLAS